MWAGIVLFLGGIMLWLALTGRRLFPAFHRDPLPPDHRSLAERAFVAIGLLVMFALGFCLQPLLERVAGWDPVVAPATTNWQGAAIAVWFAATATTWVVLSADCQAERWRGYVAATMTLTLCDLYAVVAGGTTFRGFIFSILCNLIGGTAGVWFVLLLGGWLRKIRKL